MPDSSLAALSAATSAASRPMLHRLPTGLTLLAAPMPRLASASVAVFVRAGSRDESAAQAGVSHFLEHMAFKGTATRSVQAINLAAESLGADMNAWTDKDATCYYLEGLGGHVPQMLGLLAEIVLESSFPEAELEREREVILQECTEYEEDPEQLAYMLLDEALWGDHALGRPIIGTPATISALRRAELVAHVKRHYVAGRMVVAAAGQVDPEAFFRQAEALFGGVPAGEGEAPPPPPLHQGLVKARRVPGVSQSWLHLAWPAPARSAHPYLASLAATLFGGGMSAPLVDAVRERLGLAYSVGASAELGDTHGAFVVDATTTPDKVPLFTQALARLLAEQVASVSATDLARARNQLAVSLVRASERPLSLLQRCVDLLWARGGVFDLGEGVELVQGIDGEALRSSFERMLASPAATAWVGAGASMKAAREVQGSLGACLRSG